MQNALKINKVTVTLDFSSSIDTNLKQKLLICHSNFEKMHTEGWIYRSFKSCNFCVWWEEHGKYDTDLCKIHAVHLYTDCFNFEILPCSVVM